MCDWEIRWTSERSVWAQMPESMSDARVPSQLAAWIRTNALHGILAVIPSSSGVLIEFDAQLVNTEDTLLEAAELIESFDYEKITVGTDSNLRDILIPVCYDPQVAPDIIEVANDLNSHPEQVIELHSAVSYRVNTIGFAPGFGYLRTLDQSLRIPRRETPRPRVPAGSVAIAEDMTAVYPFQSAGGWHLIGRTPMQLFDPLNENPSVLRVGDSVRFVRISFDEYIQHTSHEQWGVVDG